MGRSPGLGPFPCKLRPCREVGELLGQDIQAYMGGQAPAEVVPQKGHIVFLRDDDDMIEPIGNGIVHAELHQEFPSGAQFVKLLQFSVAASLAGRHQE